MYKLIRTTLPAFLCVVSLVACGGGSSDDGLPSNPISNDDPQVDNLEPVIEPLADQIILFGETATLLAVASDDGLPNSPLIAKWRFLSGPKDAGAPTFSATDELEVSVSFSAPGAYQFSISVSDGEFEVRSTLQVTVQAYEVTSFNNGLQVSFPANYLPSHSFDAEWVNRMWEGVADCMTGEHSWEQETAVARRSQLANINIYKKEDYDPDLHVNSGDPESWTSISVAADGLMPSEGGYQGVELAEKMVDYLHLYGSRPVDGRLICGFNHASRRHAIDTIVPTVEAKPITQNLVVEGVNIVVQADELKFNTIEQLVQISEYLTRIKNSTEHTPLKEIRIVEDIKSVANLQIWAGNGGYSVDDSMVVLQRDQLEEDLFSAPNYYYPGGWIESYRQAYEEYFWDEELREVYYMTCCLPLH